MHIPYIVNNAGVFSRKYRIKDIAHQEDLEYAFKLNTFAPMSQK